MAQGVVLRTICLKIGNKVVLYQTGNVGTMLLSLFVSIRTPVHVYFYE